jgi:uncharacterized protein YndB with AHSA1/START domain
MPRAKKTRLKGNGHGTRDVVITRTLEAPRDVVFKAWTEPEQLSQWFGPRGYSVPSPEIDPRPKGVVRLDMRAPDGTHYTNRGTVREIEEPERFAFETRGRRSCTSSTPSPSPRTTAGPPSP